MFWLIQTAHEEY